MMIFPIYVLYFEASYFKSDIHFNVVVLLRWTDIIILIYCKFAIFIKEAYK
jgi:hypothetical protein